jgi:ABC-2 type transport system ATP-binding protein
VVDHGRVITEGTAGELKQRLGTTVVELGFTTGAHATDAQAALAPLDLGAATVRDGTLQIAVAVGPRALMQALRALDAAGIEPVSAAVREPSLDDVFLALTGRPAEREEADEAPPARRGRRGRKEKVTA